MREKCFKSRVKKRGGGGWMVKMVMRVVIQHAQGGRNVKDRDTNEACNKIIIISVINEN